MSDTASFRRALLWVGFGQPSADFHEFKAELRLESACDAERLPFAVSEPRAR